MQAMTRTPPTNDEIRAHGHVASTPADEAATEFDTERVDSSAITRRDTTGATDQQLDRSWNITASRRLSTAVVDGLLVAGTLSEIARSRSLRGWTALLFTQIAFVAHRSMRRWAPPTSVGQLAGA